ncbi:DMT family transporter [Granulosicoccus sp. 3-233]|uniref:DMT family transporter n=1 Tax=Granulosicoccus sp. 3-233 TaxID=3417969 RepID=UPI003D3450E3
MNLSTPMSGIVLMILSTLVFSVQDAITKMLVQELPVAQIVFVRFVAFAIFACLFATVNGGLRTALRSLVPVRQLIRCLLMCSEIALFALALRVLGLAEVHALFACFPLVVAALSVPILGEKVGHRRWMAVIVGFIGTLIILRPGLAVFDPNALIPLVCAVIFALYNLLTRQVSRRDSFATSLVYFGITGAVASGLFAWPLWQPLNPATIKLLALLCATSICGHMMLIKALQLTEAVVLQPFHYLVLIWTLTIGYVFFRETVDGPTLLGAGIVAFSGIYVAYREFVLSRSNAGNQGVA